MDPWSSLPFGRDDDSPRRILRPLLIPGFSLNILAVPVDRLPEIESQCQTLAMPL